MQVWSIDAAITTACGRRVMRQELAPTASAAAHVVGTGVHSRRTPSGRATLPSSVSKVTSQISTSPSSHGVQGSDLHLPDSPPVPAETPSVTVAIQNQDFCCIIAFFIDRRDTADILSFVQF